MPSSGLTSSRSAFPPVLGLVQCSDAWHSLERGIYNSPPNPVGQQLLGCIRKEYLVTYGIYGLKLDKPATNVSSFDPRMEKKEVMLSTPEMLAGVKERLRLNMTELARLFDISRPTAYKWLRGESDLAERHLEIERINEISLRIQELKIERLDLLLFRPMFQGGKSFFDFLRDSGANIEKVLVEMKNAADHEALARGSIAKLGAPMRTTREALDASAMPLSLSEEE